mmetsp:Transcript_16153/g.38203  ORF Transcript_16153/g.38203 Transcript_16153/m.38203 type:complete len:260 (-) Transcript_16153:49-828(-)
MYRNDYDTDVTMWAPQGRLWQVTYAMEAVKQGSVCLGLVSDKYAVLGAYKRSPSELASYQKKTFKIDNHIGVVISGLTADARSLCRYMRSESLNHKFVYSSNIKVGRLVADVADKHQACTQSYVRRPYGVGLLVAGYDEKTGPALYQTEPSGNFYEYKAMALGARSQAAKTYLERHFEDFPGQTRDELLTHAAKALHACLESEKELTGENCTLAIVGPDEKFTIIEGDALAPYLVGLESGAGGAGGAAASAPGDAEMDD